MGYDLAGAHRLGSCPTAQVHFIISLLFFFPFFFIFSFGICLAGASIHGNINALKIPRLPAQLHLGQARLLSCFLLATGWAQQITARLHVPGQPWAGVVEGLSGESNTPGSIPSSCAPAARPRTVCYSPASPFPLLAPNTAPPRCQVPTLLPRTSTQPWHQTPGSREPKSPHKPCKKAQQWGKKGRDGKAGCSARGWVMVAKPFPQHRAMQQVTLPQHPARMQS